MSYIGGHANIRRPARDDDDLFAERTAFDALVAEQQVVVLKEQLEQAKAEIRLLTEERDAALFRIDELEMP